MSEIRLYPPLSAPMPFQMALDEILFRKAMEEKPSSALLRFYYASSPWISVGYAYAGWKEWEEGRSAAQASRVPVCRRLTGGGEVLHGRDLMFTLIAPKDFDESFGSVRVSYWKIHEVLKAALEELGCPPRFYRCDEELPKGRECFMFPIATDLAFGNKKIAGGGQKRSLGMLLHQESIQFQPPCGFEDLAAAIEHQFARAFGAEIKEQHWDPDCLFRAEKLGQEKYEVNPAQAMSGGRS
ncbi:MAG TPA: hypothetical protein VL688_07690 [Verrucomicrobiae bacterium]|jgi:lipoate-protein ligase A|nr:hypothetical protein [Verrucomicrobiae bacterium]